MHLFLFILAHLPIIGAPSPTSDKGILQINVQNIVEAEGMVWVGIYKSKEDFLIKEKATLIGVRVESTKDLLIEVPDLPFGEYAMAIFHDENNNGEMDRNLVGIPSEPFAFSKKPKSKFRLPKFEEVKFIFDRDHPSLTTTLNKWWKWKS